MIESAFLEFISLMKDMAPSVWDILIKQVYLEAVIKLVWALVWIVLILNNFWDDLLITPFLIIFQYYLSNNLAAFIPNSIYLASQL